MCYFFKRLVYHESTIEWVNVVVKMLTNSLGYEINFLLDYSVVDLMKSYCHRAA